MEDESPHPGSFLEWWFVHGCYRGPGVSERQFMVTFFKHPIRNGHRSGRKTFSYLASVLNPASGKNETTNRVDHSLVDWIIRRQHRELKNNVDRRLLDAYLNEIRRSRAMRNIEVVRARATIASFPLRLAWRDFLFQQSPTLFKLDFAEPESRRHCRFALRPRRPALTVEPAGYAGANLGGMEYRAYPRLELKGRIDGAPVAGEAWLDHQWGSLGWLVTDQPEKRVLAWDWFGLNLDDGSDWVVLVRRDAQSKNVIAQYIFRQGPRDDVDVSHNFSLKTGREWESPRTRIRYPVEWAIEAPEWSASLNFVPLAEDQEIPLFGLQRSVWEGAGLVSGRIAGKAVKGRARVELQGYGYIFDFRDFMKNFGARVDRHLKNFLPRTLNDNDLQKYVGPPTGKYEPAAYTSMLSEPVWDMISRPGKRWRPILALLLLDALGRNPEPFEAMVCSLAELCHTGSLIVDDIEDASLLRRGDQCLHLKFGQDVAINAANTLYFLPSLLIFNHPLLSARQRLDIHETMTRQYIRAHFGQALDLFWSRNLDETSLGTWMADSLAAKILQMYELKTAAPVEGLAEAVAIVAGGGASLRTACRRFASAVGTAFQITDDVNGLTRNGAKKTCGEDLAEGKLTYVLLRALERLKAGDGRRLQKIICSRKLRRQAGALAEGIELIRMSGAPAACREEAKTMLEEGWKLLSFRLKPSEPKILLETLCRSLQDL
jgi:geranylgeranyl pyrophosphate synthase/predicted secreted hydrolase